MSYASPYELKIVQLEIASLRSHGRDPWTYSKKLVKQYVRAIQRFRHMPPILVSDDGEILWGRGHVEAAKQLGWTTVPTLTLSHLNKVERQAYVVAETKLARNAGWDREILAISLKELIDLDFDVEDIGFDLAEAELIIDALDDADPASLDTPEDIVPRMTGAAVTRPGDRWNCGRHRLMQGDARNPANFEFLMEGVKAHMAFSDPPYNVKIDGHVCGSGSIKHREFAFASGEMDEGAFTSFLAVTLSNLSSMMRDGAIAFICMDWRHLSELLAAGDQAFTDLKNLIVWNKTNGGMGTFYRSKHELIFVFKVGTAEHVNNFGLGETGRYRTNVWDYPGISSMGANRSEELAMHPTVKPVALIADAMRDCSRRGDIILDCFGGSGSTLIAAQKTGRVARLMEIDPAYCDVIVRRWEAFTGKRATLAATGQTFEEVAELRLNELSIAGDGHE
ncbi:DNA modification methylase [Rhizorhabdus wittichii]|uniref:DNA modification methylase n=1 Tax=Rhizorhabdus wittichii TaxID=160791 RepID=UPI0002E0D5E7|nr:DNA modification methylase [Rhizorhabdus wittichii]